MALPCSDGKLICSQPDGPAQLCRDVIKPESSPTERENTPVRHWHTICIQRWHSITISNFFGTNHFKSYRKSGAGENEAFAEHWTFDELKIKPLVWGYMFRRTYQEMD